MRSLAAGVTAALAASEVVPVTMVKLDFPSGTIALNASMYPLVHGGTTYLGANGLGSISPITDKGGELPGMRLELLNIDAAYIALALDDADEVQGSLVTISTGLLDPTTHAIVDVLTDWVGYADTMVISEDGATATIGLTAESKGVDLLRGNPLTYSDADQQSLVSGDRYFEFVASQSDQPVVWPSKEWFRR